MYKFEFSSPEAVGIPSAALTRLLDRLNGINFIHSMLLQRHGKICWEWYRRPIDPETPHQLFSLSKSFTSAAIGMAQREGRLKLSDRLVDFFPEYAGSAHELIRRTTLRDMLSMRSGFKNCSTPRLFHSPDGDWIKTYFSLVPDGEPGTFFSYNSGGSYMVGAVLQRVTGLTLREYLMPRLFEPLDIVPGIWESCPRGLNYAGWGLYLKPRDLAKFAQLLLDKGIYQGTELIPSDYLAEATQAHADNSGNLDPDWKLGYGYQFWRSTYGYRGDGASGQLAVILPEFDVAISVTSAATAMQNILTAFWEELIPEIQAAPLRENPSALERLQEKSAGLTIPVAAGERVSGHVFRNFHFAANSSGITSCAVDCGERECSLTFILSDGSQEQLRAGFGFHVFGVFKLTDRQSHPVAASAAWRDGKLVIESFILNGIYRSTYTIDLTDGVAEPLTRQDVCTCFRPPMAHLMCAAE